MMKTTINPALEWLSGHTQPTDKILCATSGGLDSMCLAHLLHTLGYPLVIAHYHHGLRHEADGDAAFVQAWCEGRNLPFVMERGDVKGYAQENELGIEEAGRILRYGFLGRQAEAHHCAWIATAHHGDDNVETMLLNLCRGTGMTGLCGIPAISRNIMRPLLSLSRADLEVYAQENAITHVTDHTNADEGFARNRLRHQVLPILESINPQMVAHFTKTAQQLTRENAYITAQAQAIPRQVDKRDITFLQADLEREPALAHRAIHQAICQVGYHSRDIASRHVDAVFGLCGQVGQVSLPYGLIAKSTKAHLIVERPLVLPAFLPVAVDATTGYGQWMVQLTTTPRPGSQPIYLPPGTYTVTTWRKADRFGSRSLKRRFVDCGIAPDVRDTLPVVRCDDQAVAALHVGVNPDFVLSREGTSPFYITFTYCDLF